VDKHSWKDAVPEGFEKIDIKGREWTDKSKGLLRKEMDSAL